jgi:asparagine synthase (glutamine-hydrolysing)
MCGIVGVVEAQGPADAGAVVRAAQLLEHRGPDDSGLWTEDGTVFAHRRLAVIDLTDAGHQPMLSADGRYVMVYNGEVYNHRELRREIDPSETAWRGHSDTEVILAAYARWGANCLARLRGMFALAIWDRRERTLFAARDRLGVKPFYYHHSAARFAFASRPRAVTALHREISGRIDVQALRLYLEAGYVPEPWSIHEGVRKLPPAHFLEWRDGRVRVERYWDLGTIQPDPHLASSPENELLDQLEALVARSVRYRLESDVPLGVFLSGGIDSSLVVAMMQRQSASPVKTYTIGFDEPGYDESAYGAQVASHLGCEHSEERLRVDDLLELLPKFRAEYDEPFSDSAAFPTLAVSRLARSEVTVALSGDGGDELFGGYHYYRIADILAPVYGVPSAIRALLARCIACLPTHRFQLLAGALRQQDSVAAFSFARSVAKDFASPLLPEAVVGTRSLADLFGEAADAMPRELAHGEYAARLDALYTLPGDYLQKVDVASMAFSLEAREPLLDHELAEWAMRLPWQLKRRGAEGKYLLRRLAYRMLPRALLDRPKQGFTMPVDRWLRGPLKTWAQERIESRDVYSRVPLDAARVRSLFDLHAQGKRNAQPLLWAVLMLLDFAACA